MTIPRFIPALAFFAAVAGSSQASPADKPVPSKTTSNVHARGAPMRSNALSDADLEKAIAARFARSKISTNKFTCHVQGGVATLEGKTEIIQHKGTATRLAKSAGAIAVVNHIQISQAAKDKAANNLASGRRRVQVKRGDAVARTEAR